VDVFDDAVGCAGAGGEGAVEPFGAELFACVGCSWAEGFDDAVGVEDECVVMLEVEFEGGVPGVVEDAEGDGDGAVDGEDVAGVVVWCASEDGSVVSRVGVAERAAVGAEECADGGDEGVFDAFAREVFVEVGEDAAWAGFGVLWVCVEDGLDHGDDDGGAGAVTGDVGDEDGEPAVVTIEEVEEVSAGLGGGEVTGGDVEPVWFGGAFGEEGLLDHGDALEFAGLLIDESFELSLVDEIFGHASDEVAAHKEVLDGLWVDAVGFFAHGDGPVEGAALVVEWDGGEAVHVGHVRAEDGVVGEVEVVIELWRVVLDDVAEESAGVGRQFVPVFPGVFAFEAGVVGVDACDFVGAVGEASSGEADVTLDGVELLEVA